MAQAQVAAGLEQSPWKEGCAPQGRGGCGRGGGEGGGVGDLNYGSKIQKGHGTSTGVPVLLEKLP